MTKRNTRATIIEKANNLFYESGVEHTSFADIAQAVQISRGNFYHHFKTRDEILAAVIELRVLNTRKLLEKWENDGETPFERIKCFIHILLANFTQIKHYGCPVGTLTTELTKINHQHKNAALEIFELFKEWLERQFRELGKKKASTKLAIHLLARVQGIAVIANAYQDEKFVDEEVKQLVSWLKTLSD